MAFEYDGKIYRNLEEQVDYNKDCINDLDLRVTTLEGKEIQLDTRVTALENTPVYTPTDLDLNTGIVAVTYDTTDGISLTTQGTIKSNKGTNQVVVDYEIPIVAGNNILIDKKANEDKIEVKLDRSKDIKIIGGSTNSVYFTSDSSAFYSAPEGSIYTSFGDQNGISRIWQRDPGGLRAYTFPTNTYGEHTVLTSKYVKTLFGNKSIVGTGNIDLFNHDIKIVGTDPSINVPYEVHVFKTSSNNFNVDSLTDLKTLLGNTFQYWNVNGWLKNNVDYKFMKALYITETEIDFVDPTVGLYPVSLAGATFTDDVTTV